MIDVLSGYPQTARALAAAGAPAIVERWLGIFARSPLRMPGGLDARMLAAPARGIVDELLAMLPEPGCAPGGPALRDAEKRFAFAGATLGGSGATGFDVQAFVLALRDVVMEVGEGAVSEARDLRRLFDWLAAVTFEGYAGSRQEALRLRHRDALEKGTPVIMVTRELPALLLVGDPDRSVLESAFGRLLLSIVRVGARAVVVDGGGLITPHDPAVLEALAAFGGHRKLARVAVVLCALADETAKLWTAQFASGVRIERVDRFDDAVALAQKI